MPTDAGRPFTGSEDFMDLFQSDAAWREATGHLQVFKLYGEWVAYHATDQQLNQVVLDLRSRGLALAVEAGPLNAGSCGVGVEGFAGTDEGTLIANRIMEAGGTIDLIALDEPYYFAHVYDGPNACYYPVEQIAAEVGEYIDHMRSFFPEVIIGDTEPLPQPVNSEDIADWLLTFREVNGYDLPFIHLDIDWSRTDWPDLVKRIEDFGAQEGIPVGIIYNGNAADPNDEVWISITGERIKRYELQSRGRPAHVVFQSWTDLPDYVLPEDRPFTFTNLIGQYFADKEGLGYNAAGPNANLAIGQPVRVSSYLANNDGVFAVDGDVGTLWSSGAGPTQWIEIDFEEPKSVAQVSLVISQYPAGETTHQLYGRGLDTGGELVLLHTFTGHTEDGQSLVFTPNEPLMGIEAVRVVTTISPSWVAWREIEILSATE